MQIIYRNFRKPNYLNQYYVIIQLYKYCLVLFKYKKHLNIKMLLVDAEKHYDEGNKLFYFVLLTL